MNYLRAFLVLAALSLPSSASPQTPEFWNLGSDTLAFHEDLFREQGIKVEPVAAHDAEIFVALIRGIPNFSKINSLHLTIRRSFGLNNGGAVFHNGFRFIVYDPDWAKSAPAEAYLVLGHEAGHHFCEHTIGNFHGSLWEKELEADRFAGASVKRLEVYHDRSFIRDVMAVAATRYTESGSPSHPPRELRLEAIRKGYDEGSPCGGLAPAVRGSGGLPLSEYRKDPYSAKRPCETVRQTGPTSYDCTNY